MMTAMMSVLVVMACVNTWLLWRVFAAAGKVERMSERVDGFGNALDLLADATESGFKDIGTRLTPPAPPEPAPVRNRVRRTNGSPRQSRTIAEIAAAEGISEGEAGLRQRLAKPRRAAAASAKA